MRDERLKDSSPFEPSLDVGFGRWESVLPVAFVGSGLVAALATVVSGAGYRAMLRTGNRDIGFVVAGFAVLAAKNVAKLALLAQGDRVPEPWEVAFVAADVASISLVAWPFLRRWAR